MHLAQVGRSKLRYGNRRPRAAVGAVLARASLPVKDWEPHDPAEERPLRIEYAFVAIMMVVAAWGWFAG